MLRPQARPGVAQRIETAYARQGAVGATEHIAEVRKAREDAAQLRKEKRKSNAASKAAVKAPQGPAHKKAKRNPTVEKSKARPSPTSAVVTILQTNHKPVQLHSASAACRGIDSEETVLGMAKILLTLMDKSAQGQRNQRDHSIADRTERGCRFFQISYARKTLCQVTVKSLGRWAAKSELLAKGLVECHVLGFGKEQLELAKKRLRGSAKILPRPHAR